ncbi:MAG: hypothetical protein JO033_12005 [Acidobacteriaceae bacterium]|nr:hypothetical protein [Acidobacteriaceae bacterium]
MQFTPLREEQAEVAAVLDSGIFQRAPLLESFFRYVCSRYFEGQGAAIKEYSIAVEALNRPPAFDSKKDSIVRVEAHRLRKRLQGYYKGPGASHPIQIVIPNGQYVPQFVLQELPKEPVSVPEEAPQAGTESGFAKVEIFQAPAVASPVEAPVSAKERPRNWVAVFSFALVGFAVAAAVLAFHRHAASKLVAGPETWSGSFTEPVPMEYRMLTGYHGAPFTDGQGHAWSPDSYFTGGQSSPIPPQSFIQGQPDPHLLRSQRSGTFRYDIPLRQGTYELHLYFAETEYGSGNPRGGGDGTRSFGLTINGRVRIPTLDPLADAGGPNRFHGRVFKDISPAADGRLHLTFSPLTGPGLLNAMEILSTAPGCLRPVRIVAQPIPVTDSEGHIWSADEFFLGGTPVFRAKSVANIDGKVLFQGERYGNFSYRIPLAPGKYRLTLHFAETWFGTPGAAQPLNGARLFNVFANGIALLRNFEVAKEAGGSYRGLEKIFNDIEPNAQGVLVLEFVPLKNYAEVNAIEVVSTDNAKQRNRLEQ